MGYVSSRMTIRGFTLLAIVILMSSYISTYAFAGSGVSTSSTGTSSTSQHSTVSSISNGYDGNQETYTELKASGDSGLFSTCSYNSFAEVTYTLSLNSSGNQTISMFAFSQTVHSTQDGWSDVPELMLFANITDNSGTFTAWSSNVTNNSLTASPREIDLGSITPRLNSTIDVNVRIQHNGTFTSNCVAYMYVYDFTAQSTVSLPSISYQESSYLFTKDTAITDLVPTNTGGAASSWSITSGSLPSGLAFSTSTGVISGTPDSVTSSNSITIEATNSAGSDSATISISVQDLAPSISYSGSEYLFTKDTAITDLVPTNTGGAVVMYSVSPSLPLGLALDTTTGVISGTPTAFSSSSTYTITGTNSAGSDNTAITISVQNEAPSISYSGSPYLFTKDTAITDLVPTNTGGAASSWSITSGSLPSGLAFSASTGVISGIPDSVTNGNSITIEATNSVGSDSTTISISVQDKEPFFYYPQSDYIFEFGYEIEAIVPEQVTTEFGTWSVSDNLPAGLMFNDSTGVITGNLTIEVDNLSLTVNLTNERGTYTKNLEISVIKSPGIFLEETTYSFVVGEEIEEIRPMSYSNFGQWNVSSGSLPNGLVLDTSTGIISGTPISITQSSSFTLTQINSIGNSSVVIETNVKTYYAVNLDSSTEFTNNSFNYIEDANQPLSNDCNLLGERNSSYRCLTDGSTQINNSVIAISENNVYYNIIMVIPEGNPDVVTPEFSSEVIDDPVTPNQEESDYEQLRWIDILGMFVLASVLFSVLIFLYKFERKKQEALRMIYQVIEDNDVIQNKNEVYVFSQNFISTWGYEELWDKRFFSSLLFSLKASTKSLGNRLSRNIETKEHKISGLPSEVINYYHQNGKQQPNLYLYKGSRKSSIMVLQLGELYVFLGIIKGSHDSISKEDRTWENIRKMGAFPKTKLPARFEYEYSLFNKNSQVEFKIESPQDTVVRKIRDYGVGKQAIPTPVPGALEVTLVFINNEAEPFQDVHIIDVIPYDSHIKDWHIKGSSGKRDDCKITTKNIDTGIQVKWIVPVVSGGEKIEICYELRSTRPLDITLLPLHGVEFGDDNNDPIKQDEATVETTLAAVAEEPNKSTNRDTSSNQDNFREIVLAENRVSMLVNESAKRCKLRFTVEDVNNRLEWIKFYTKMFEFEQKPRENNSSILWHNISLDIEPEEVENGYEIELSYDKVIETTQKSIESGSLYKMLNGSSNSFIIPSLETKILEEFTPSESKPGITWTHIEQEFGENLSVMLREFWEPNTRLNHEYNSLLSPFFVPTLNFLLQDQKDKTKQKSEHYSEIKKNKQVIKDINTTIELIRNEIEKYNSNDSYTITGCTRMHGDLRPDNLLANQAGELYLCDFSDYVWVDNKENVGRMEYNKQGREIPSNSFLANDWKVPQPNWITDISKFVASSVLKLPYESAHRVNDYKRAKKRKLIENIVDLDFVERMTYDIRKSSTWVTDSLDVMYSYSPKNYDKEYIRLMYLLSLFDRLIQITIYWKADNERGDWEDRVKHICTAISNSIKDVESSNENPNGKDKSKSKNTKNLSVSINSSGGSVVAIGDGAIASGGDIKINNNYSPKPVIPKITQIMFYKTDRFRQQVAKQEDVISFVAKLNGMEYKSLMKFSKLSMNTSIFPIYKFDDPKYSIFYTLILNEENSYTMFVISMGLKGSAGWTTYQKDIDDFISQIGGNSLEELNQALEAKCVRLEELVNVGFIRCKACGVENSLSDQVCVNCGKDLHN